MQNEQAISLVNDEKHLNFLTNYFKFLFYKIQFQRYLFERIN